MGAPSLTTDNFADSTAKGISLIDFWATWCGPCKMLTPVIDQLSEEYEGRALVAKVNCEEEPELVQKFGIRSIPAIYVLKDGQIVEQFVGVRSKEDLSKALDEAGA